MIVRGNTTGVFFTDSPIAWTACIMFFLPARPFSGWVGEETYHPSSFRPLLSQLAYALLVVL